MNTISIIVDKQYETADIKIERNNRVKYYATITVSSANRILHHCDELISICDVNCYAEYVYKIKSEQNS